jgi:GTP pyrophosphokinase
LEKSFKELLNEIKKKYPKADLGRINSAWEFAKLAHTGQTRKSGDAYVTHPLAVAKILTDWNMDVDSIIAGLLHDTIEDGGAKRSDLVDQFGESVALLVDGVTNVANLRLKNSFEEKFVENLRKMVLFMAKDIRVVIVKLADRLHNMRTLEFLPPEKQVKIAKETLEVYAPLAERLGMGSLKGELEDLAFKYVHPDEYKKVLDLYESLSGKAEPNVVKMKSVLYEELSKIGLKPEISGRKKHFYSLWKKLNRKEIEWDIDKIHDIIALRIVVDSVAHCYTALGAVHSQYKPAPHLGVSDFIAQPKPNGYQSIHTKVFGPGGRIAEVQIRTYQMHDQAEHGIAAHWAYSEAKSHGASDAFLTQKSVVVPKDKLSWVRQLVEWQKEITDSKEFFEAMKFDAFNHRNFVFSPKGDVFDLPRDATPIDYAYNVHTNLGKYIQGAKVNGKIVPLNHRLKSGDVVEIIKSKNPHLPNRDWMEFVVTTMAKREIGKQLRRQSQ